MTKIVTMPLLTCLNQGLCIMYSFFLLTSQFVLFIRYIIQIFPLLIQWWNQIIQTEGLFISYLSQCPSLTHYFLHLLWYIYKLPKENIFLYLIRYSFLLSTSVHLLCLLILCILAVRCIKFHSHSQFFSAMSHSE